VQFVVWKLFHCFDTSSFKNEELDNNRNHPAADGTLCSVSPAGTGRLALPAPRGAPRMMAPAEAQMAAVETDNDKHGATRVTLTPNDNTQPLYYVLVKESFSDNLQDYNGLPGCCCMGARACRRPTRRDAGKRQLRQSDKSVVIWIWEKCRTRPCSVPAPYRPASGRPRRGAAG